jgi:hypothetical protein
VPLVETIKLLLFGREQQMHWGSYTTIVPGQQSCALVEEFLFWVAVLHRWGRLAGPDFVNQR